MYLQSLSYQFLAVFCPWINDYNLFSVTGKLLNAGQWGIFNNMNLFINRHSDIQ